MRSWRATGGCCDGREMPAFLESGVNPDGAPTTSRPRFGWSFFLWPWLAFWILLFLLGLQEYQWSGGLGLWDPALEYGTAALTSTTISVLH